MSTCRTPVRTASPTRRPSPGTTSTCGRRRRSTRRCTSPTGTGTVPPDPEWFYSDGIHLTPAGSRALSQFVVAELGALTVGRCTNAATGTPTPAPADRPVNVGPAHAFSSVSPYACSTPVIRARRRSRDARRRPRRRGTRGVGRRRGRQRRRGDSDGGRPVPGRFPHGLPRSVLGDAAARRDGQLRHRPHDREPRRHSARGGARSACTARRRPTSSST